MHAVALHGDEAIAVGSSAANWPRLIASRDDRDLPTTDELKELIAAIGGPGAFVVSRSNESRTRAAHESLGGSPLCEHLPLRLYRHPITAKGDMEIDSGIRMANEHDREIISSCIAAFAAHTGGHAPDDPLKAADEGIAQGRIRVLESEGDVVAVGQVGSRPAAGQIRIGLVYVPENQRRQGFAGRLVTSMTAEVHAMSAVPCLFTDADNAGTDALYKSLGYEPVEELVHLEPEA
jgi:GNAT superfamily N-acetyltransferase